ncbi:MAG: peroxiredoxin-like family protein [Bacteroidota bacterium]
MQDQTSQLGTLKEALDERRASFATKADDYTKKVFEEGIQAVLNDGTLQAAKQVGDTAPNFSLQNATGKTIELQDYLAQGKVILTWYRGGWCPYCNLQLRHMQNELPNFKAKGANLIALTPEVPDKSLSTTEKNELQFEVLSDVGNTVAKEYGLVFKLIPEVAKIYQKAFDLHGFNGDESDELPLAATYVIDQEGKITYAFLDFDYRNRAEPKDILAAL